MEPKAMRKVKTKWSAPAEILLCGMWKERICQLRGNGRKCHVYKELAERLADHGFIFTGEEVHVKINNLAAKYRKEKQLITSSEGLSEWPLFGIMDEIYDMNNFERVEVKEEELLAVLQEENLRSEPLPSSTSRKLKEDCETLTPDAFSPCAKRRSSSPEGSFNSTILWSASSTASYGAKKRKAVSQLHSLLLNELKTANKQFNEMLSEDRENTKLMLAIEEQRNRMLEKFLSDTKQFQNNILGLLKNNNSSKK